MKIDEALDIVDKVISDNIQQCAVLGRGFASQNILAQMRNLVELVSLKAFLQGENAEVDYCLIKKANAHVKGKGDLAFLGRFHKLLQVSASHYTLDQGNSERLMLKYYEYLLRIRLHLQETYGISVLGNLDEYPLDLDPAFSEYHCKIAEEVERMTLAGVGTLGSSRYRLYKVKPFFVKGEIYYEVTFSPVSERAGKTDLVIAFTKLDLSQNYSVKISVASTSIGIMGKSMPVFVITGWQVAIRPCELKNLAYLLGISLSVRSSSVEYQEIMKFLTETGYNLVDYVLSHEDYYSWVKIKIAKKAKEQRIYQVFDACRSILLENAPGCNVIRYLLHDLDNRVIKLQKSHEPCEKLSSLKLKYGCIPFDKMPFCTSLLNHNPKFADIVGCVDVTGREHELFARHINNNTTVRGQLYTQYEEVAHYGGIDKLIQHYNDLLYYKHASRQLKLEIGHVFIQEYEEDTLFIIKYLIELAAFGVDGYSDSVEDWIRETIHRIDCEEKKEVLKNMFSESRVALVYGSAGTGKSTIVEHLSAYCSGMKKVYLCNTNPAVDNLKRRELGPNCTFSTIAKFLRSIDEYECDVLVVDECSTVSNMDMRKILERTSFKMLLLVGDVYQIESIVFGNWFDIARSFVPETARFELKVPWRSKSEELLELWTKVRSMGDDVAEHIARYGYSSSLDISLFEKRDDDEVVLCLNYDGLYGINNINRFLQYANSNQPFSLGIHTYKVGDPILFNESDRFAPAIYNNMKGVIVGISDHGDRMQFDIELEKRLKPADALGQSFRILRRREEKDVTTIRFDVKNVYDRDEDEGRVDPETVIPFQVAYAVSIHKAQGLEYLSVKVVITHEAEEFVTHNIFYTAITRARKKLKIYWSPETENHVLSALAPRDSGKDASILAAKYGLMRS